MCACGCRILLLYLPPFQVLEETNGCSEETEAEHLLIHDHGQVQCLAQLLFKGPVRGLQELFDPALHLLHVELVLLLARVQGDPERDPDAALLGLAHPPGAELIKLDLGLAPPRHVVQDLLQQPVELGRGQVRIVARPGAAGERRVLQGRVRGREFQTDAGEAATGLDDPTERVGMKMELAPIA